MLRNYSTIAWRHLKRDKLYSVINLLGLAIGLAVALFIGLWVWNELTFDHYFKNHGRLAQTVSITSMHGVPEAGINASVPTCAVLRNKYPEEIKDAALFTNASPLLAVDDKKVEQRGMWTQAGFPAMLTLKMVSGSQGALSDPYAMLISQSTAKALFGETDPLNKTVRVGNRTDMKVRGVYEDIPDNTSLTGLGFLLAWANKDNPGDSARDDWSNHHFGLYVQVSETADMDRLSARIKDITKPFVPGKWEELLLHPMDRWRLYDDFENGKMVAGRANFVRLICMIGAFVLFLACINFMNLSTARSGQRAKEVGIRKTIGSLRRQLVLQFMTESFLFVLLSLLLAVGLVGCSLPAYNMLIHEQLVLPFGNAWFWLLLLGFAVFTGIAAGSYPAFYLSGFKPVLVLKGILRNGGSASLFRKSLVVLQFTVSIILIIGSMVVFRQLDYIKNRPTGYSREGLISVEMNTPELKEHYAALRDELLQSGVVKATSESSSPLTNVRNAMFGYKWKGSDPTQRVSINTVFVSADFGRTVDWKIIDGRDFIPDFKSDSEGIILNEAAVRFTGLKHPVGEVIKWHDVDHRILGVIQDMVMESPFGEADPTFFMYHDWSIRVITVRIRPDAPLRTALAKIEGLFKKYNPASPFVYQFTDAAYAAKFAAEEQLEKMVTLFTVLAIFISCLGLFGLASFVTEQRTREIGVRKVLGASVFSIWQLLSREFALLVLLSCGIAIPLAWYFSYRWLEQYAWHARLTWWLFTAAGAGALLLSLLTVSWQTIRAALANPAKSLK